jgi:hypothetical protein
MPHRGDARAVNYLCSASESGRERLRSYWLANVFVHPSRQALLPVAGHGMSGHGDDVGLRKSAIAGSNPAGRFVTVYFSGAPIAEMPRDRAIEHGEVRKAKSRGLSLARNDAGIWQSIKMMS